MTVEYLVEEGPFCYPLDSAACGWGVIKTGVPRGRVLVVRVDSEGDARLLAQAEIRTSLERPWRNAARFAEAAAVLTQQGCLARDGDPITLQARQEPALAPMDTLNWGMSRLLPSLGSTLLWRLGLARLQWNIGILRGGLPLSAEFPWDGVRWLEAPADASIADPFVATDGRDTWLFYERESPTGGPGEIWAARLDVEAARISDAEVALKGPHHLSFPNVFRWEGHWYLLPEQSESGSTSLYRASEFPRRWEEHVTLLAGFPGADPVLFRHDGLWWLLATRDGGPCMDNNLHLFWAERLEGPYHAHAANPVRTGLFGSRMAGPIHRQDGRLIRPAQDGRECYGSGVALFEIVTLNRHTYAERPICAWKPDPSGPYTKGFHTIHACGNVVVIDGRRQTRLRPELNLLAGSIVGPLAGPLETLALVV